MYTKIKKSGLVIVFDQTGFENNKIFGWIPIEHLVKSDNLAFKLPNGKMKFIKSGWIVNDKYASELFRYATLEITDKCAVTCVNFCARSIKRRNNQSDYNFTTLEFAKTIAEHSARNHDVIKKRYGFTAISDTAYGNSNRLTFEDFAKIHVNRRTPQPAICISGGEPTENKEYRRILKSIMELADNNDIKVVFATNLTNCFEEGFFDFFADLSNKHTGRIELQLSYNTALINAYNKLASTGAENLMLGNRFNCAKVDVKDKHLLLSFIDYAFNECFKRDVNIIMLRITRNESLNDLLESEVINHFITKRGARKIKCYGERLEENNFAQQAGVELNYYMASTAQAGFAEKHRNNERLLRKTFPDEIYAAANGRIFPHMAWRAGNFGWIGTRE